MIIYIYIHIGFGPELTISREYTRNWVSSLRPRSVTQREHELVVRSMTPSMHVILIMKNNVVILLFFLFFFYFINVFYRLARDRLVAGGRVIFVLVIIIVVVLVCIVHIRARLIQFCEL